MVNVCYYMFPSFSYSWCTGLKDWAGTQNCTSTQNPLQTNGTNPDIQVFINAVWIQKQKSSVKQKYPGSFPLLNTRCKSMFRYPESKDQRVWRLTQQRDMQRQAQSKSSQKNSRTWGRNRLSNETGKGQTRLQGWTVTLYCVEVLLSPFPIFDLKCSSSEGVHDPH